MRSATAGEIEVHIECSGEKHWRSLVRDTGPEMAEDPFEAIFRAYRPLDGPGCEARTMGIGLNLAITRHLVKMIKGEIHFGSDLGRGATFEVILPLVEASPAFGAFELKAH